MFKLEINCYFCVYECEITYLKININTKWEINSTLIYTVNADKKRI